ncbi:helix-turn-helix domain-containing protein [Patescibacteria group bacterium]|nr:helix-turn-helix domain-containing protein [Patescibacteria group bacterium]MBU2235962.1 helix-turn-helix domain-containing protein [Patescibacteria group bacterium]
MVSFKGKEIRETRTLGDKLREAREEEGVSLTDVENAIQIRKEYLQYLEEGQYSKLPGEVYIRNFLSKYASYLRLNPKRVIALFEEEKKIFQNITPLEKHPTDGKGVVQNHPIINPKFLRNGFIVLVIISLLIYFGIEISQIMSPPTLVIYSPQEDNITTTEHSYEIVGQTEKETTILINGEEILADPNGYFQAVVDLKEGINILEITSVRKSSKENTIYKKIRVEPNES